MRHQGTKHSRDVFFCSEALGVLRRSLSQGGYRGQGRDGGAVRKGLEGNAKL